jgi:hypothetical protein
LRNADFGFRIEEKALSITLTQPLCVFAPLREIKFLAKAQRRKERVDAFLLIRNPQSTIRNRQARPLAAGGTDFPRTSADREP